MSSVRTSERVEFRLLGPFEVNCGGRSLEVGSGKQRAVLAILLLHLNKVVPRDRLIQVLWGEDPPPSATTTLHSLISRLRRALADTGDGAGGPVVRSRAPGYVLEADPDCVDAHRFERLAARAHEQVDRSEPEAAVRALHQALELWRGDALADLADASFARLAANRLEEAHLTAVEDLADAELACGRPSEAAALLEPHVATHPFRERACGQLMLSLYRLGRQAEALAAYRTVRRVAVDELGVEPTPGLRRLEQQILHQSPELDGPERCDQTATLAPSPRSSPGHTIAFLFTDIEASTRRWEGDQQAMARDVARHDELLRGEVERAHGNVFTHTGDGLAASFPTTTAALAAAVSAQRALLGERWAAAGSLPVRMAVHAGAAESRGGSYFGPTLNRVARLMAIAAGGQVLCSQAAAELARDELPSDVSLLDLGEHALADLTRPERVFQVAAAGLPADFPPLRSVGARRQNLPVALSAFVGRSQELEELKRLVVDARLLTLTGVGGAGKTRLAIELAAAAVDTFPGGVWFVELGPLRDPTLVTEAVSAAVGVQTPVLGSTSRRLEEQLCAHLRSRRVLVVLDNCEHLIESSAGLIHTLLSHCPEVSILTTSREVLGLPGEVAWRVPPLSLPPSHPTGVDDLSQSDAVALFYDRARAARAGFALTRANATAVAQICQRLDGIPLALELAAARIRVLSAQQVAEHLDDRFRLLTGGPRSAVPRHQTLRAAMDWSYEALPAREQAVLRRISVFPATFDRHAAEAVAGEDEAVDACPGFEVLDLLTRLVDKSLVVAQPEREEVRFTLLETVRQYAAERLAETGESLATHRRHRGHFVQRAEWQRIGFWPDDVSWFQRARDDEDNFRAALTWSLTEGDEESALHLAASMWLHWLWAGRSEGVGCLEQALAGGTRLATPARVEAMIGLAYLLRNSDQSDPSRSQRLLQEALELAERLGDRRGETRVRLLLAESALTWGDIELAERLLNRALQGCEESSVTARAWCHYHLGSVAVVAGDTDRATAHLERALALARRGSLTVLTPHLLAALAPLAALAGDGQRGLALADEAVWCAADLRLVGVTTLVLTRATETRMISGCHAEARATLRQVLRLLRDLHARNFVADALEMAALVAERAGRVEAAARLLGTSMVVRDTQGEPFGGTRVLSSAVRECPPRVLEALGARRYGEETARGQQVSINDAITCALAEVESEAP